MKKIFVLAAAVLSAVSLVSCSKKGNEKKVIGIVQQMDHNSLNLISDNIKSKLSELGYNEENSVIMYKQGDNDMTTLSQIVEEYANNKADVVIAIATKAANAALLAADSKIPVVFAACSDPVGSKLLQNMEQPEGYVTGTCHAIQSGVIFEMAKKINPNMKKIGMIHTSGEANAQSTVNVAIENAKKLGLDSMDVTIDEIGAIQETIKKMAENRCDAVFVPNDNKLAARGNMAILGAACIEYKLPLYCAADSQVQDGGFANIGITYDVLGQVTGVMADKILKGAAVKDVPVKIFNQLDELSTFVNKKTADALGITIPEEMKSGRYVEF